MSDQPLPVSAPNPAPPVAEDAAAVPPVGAPPPLPPAEPVLTPFVFHGSAGEYFRIWIVNTLLTILTLGVFGAWATVRKRRYLRGNAELLGHRFDYHANPWRLLVGNVVVATLFVGYLVVGEVYPLVRLAVLAVGGLLLPWIVVRSLAFNAHNTSYRGLRFYFRQPYGAAALLYLGQAFLLVLTLGFYYPAWQRNRREFTISHHRLGDAFFRFDGGNGPFYRAYLLAAGMLIIAAFFGGLATALLVAGNGGRVPNTAQLVPFFLIYGLTFFIARHFVHASLFNHVWNHTSLDQHRFVARMKTSAWIRLQFENLGAMIVSCGLLHPWAVVRSSRFAAASLHFRPAGSIAPIARLGRNDGSAVGETTADFIGLDFGL